MQPTRALAFAALLVTLFGCAAPVPLASNFPIVEQRVARTAAHWDVMAADVVLQTSQFLSTASGMQGRAVFIQPTARNTAFDDTFKEFIINRMTTNGLEVKVCANGPGQTGFSSSPDVTIHYSTRVIKHTNLPYYRPGVLTALASGLFVGRSIALSNTSRDTAAIAGVALLAGLDAATGYFSAPTNTELIVTTTIHENNKFLMRRSDIYYVPDGDANLFVRHVSTSIPCEQRGNTAQLYYQESMDQELLISDMVANSMRRSNPKWTSEASAR